MFPVLGADGTIYVGLGFSFCAIKPDMTTKWCTKLRADVSGSAAAVQAPNVTGGWRPQIRPVGCPRTLVRVRWGSPAC
jgi:hypothetical protein